ncbi:hypothetical protein H0O02_04850 [Candidatus Micrarchaeota archaeon]|nr:hypothetical protein [Candidatus Micrarchaeota archaeon]
MSEKNIAAKPENVAKEQVTEKQDKPGILSKLPRPLAESIVGVAAVALIAGCGMNTNGGNHPYQDGDAGDSIPLETIDDNASEDELDGVESDVPDAVDDEVAEVVDEDAEADAVEEDAVEEDAGGEDMIADVPAEDAEEDAEVEEDAPVDVVDADMVDAVDTIDAVDATDAVDADAEVAEEDVIGEDVAVVCSAVDETRTEWISNGGSETVGNVTVEYSGLDASGNGLYDLLCGDVVVRSGVAVAHGPTLTVDVSEQGFQVMLTANILQSWGSNVTIEVNAH